MAEADIKHRKTLLKAWGLKQKGVYVKGWKDDVAHLAAQIVLDGDMGPSDRLHWHAARIVLAAFQEHLGYSPTGIWNRATIAELEKLQPVPPVETATEKILHVAAVCYAHRWQIHYSSPYHDYERNYGIEHDITLPKLIAGATTWADCSSAVRYWYWLCGFPDPMGADYQGNGGNSATLFERGEVVGLGREIPGDVACYGPGGDEHAALVVAKGRVLSNGEYPEVYEWITEHSGPLAIRRFQPFV